MRKVPFKLTNHQREFATENHNLIYDFIYKRGLNLDDWYGVIAEAYCKAVAKYDPTRGAQFTTYAFFVMDRAVAQERVAQKTSIRKANAEAVSLEDKIPGTDLTFLEVVQSPTDEESNIIDKIVIENAMSTLNPDECALINRYAQGYRQREMARVYNCSHQAIGNRIHKIREKLIKAL